jgi:hypothetical protein
MTSYVTSCIELFISAKAVTCVFLPGTGCSVNLTVPAWDWTCVKLTMPMTGTYIDLTMGTCDALSILAKVTSCTEY